MAKPQNKTQPTQASVEAFLAAITPEQRRDDCRTLCALMARLSGEPPTLWGPAMVGFGTRHYAYESGREGDIFKIGFSPRKTSLALYVTHRTDTPLVKGLGKFKAGVACINVNKLADIDLAKLETLIRTTLSTKAACGAN
jgi:hypothetical protein